ncbi:MAG: ArsA family ATPase [Nitrospirae bacterium]|nr:ArsA family ATPase [Nitrospirota bacterium]
MSPPPENSHKTANNSRSAGAALYGGSSFLRDLIREREILIFGGAGGVGKTTLAACVALQAAIEGKKTLVMTIDPARRLADSLGVRELGNEEHEVDLTPLARNGEAPKGKLFALMLDPKKTFDDMVRSFSPSAEVTDRVFNNRLYQQITSSLAGMYEYSAIEKVYEIHQSRVYDLIVVDTPPTKHALEFLDAPNKLVEFFRSGVVRWFLKPYLSVGKIGLRVMQAGSDVLFKIFEAITGFSIVRDVSDFFIALQDLWDGLVFRAEKASEVLLAKETSFVLVTSPHQQNIREIAFYHAKLVERKIPFGGIIVNRFHFPYLPKSKRKALLDQTEAAIRGEMNRGTQAKHLRLLDNLRAIEDISDFDRLGVELLGRKIPRAPVALVPALPTDVYSLTGLQSVNQHLFAE